MHRRALLAAAALLLPGAALAHPHEALTQERAGAIEQQIMRLRERLRTAAQAKDVATLRRLYAAGYTHTHASGKVDGRDARILALVAGEAVIELAPVEELTIRILNADAAVVTGRSRIAAAERTSEVRWLQAMARVEGEWQIAASQATTVPPAA